MIEAKQFEFASLSDEEFKSKFNEYNPEKIKSVLIIGNGFDLASGLCTKYSDFIKFIMYYLVLSKAEEIDVFNFVRQFTQNNEKDADVLNDADVLPIVALAKKSDKGNNLESKITKYVQTNFFYKFLCKILKQSNINNIINGHSNLVDDCENDNSLAKEWSTNNLCIRCWINCIIPLATKFVWNQINTS